MLLGREKLWIYLDADGKPFKIKGAIVKDSKRDTVFEEYHSVRAVRVEVVYWRKLNDSGRSSQSK